MEKIVGTVDVIDVEPRHLKMVRSVLAQCLPHKVVWAYGSRVKWNATERSDLDCVVFDATDTELYNAREAFDESDIPFKVQVLSWDSIPSDFKDNISNKYFVLQTETSWRECRLGDVVTLQRGHDLPKTKMIEGYIPVAGSNGIIGYHNQSTTKAIGVTIGRSGNIGNAYMYKKDFWAHNTTLYVKDFKGNNEIFIYYFLKNIDFKSFNSGSAVPTLNRNHIHPLDVVIPKPAEQKAIAEVLSSLDDKIDLLHRQNNTLESLAETLFRHYFIDNAHDDWEEGTLGDVISVIESGSRPKGGIDHNLTIGIASVGAESIKGIGNFNFSATKFISPEFFAKMKKGKVCDKDVLIYKDGAYIGRKSMFGCNFPFKEFAVNEHVFILRANELVSQYFLYFALNEEELSSLNTNSAQPGLNQTSMKSFEITIPPKEIIEKFDMEVEDLVDKILYNAKQIQTLEKLRDTLLPKLISGDIRLQYKEVV